MIEHPAPGSGRRHDLLFLLHLASHGLVAVLLWLERPAIAASAAAWASVCTLALLLDHWCAQSARMAGWPPARRQWLLRASFWLYALLAGSAGWLLYEPPHPAYPQQITLNLGLACIAVIVTLRPVQDFARTAVGIALCLVPLALRNLLHGDQETYRGLGELVITAMLVLLAHSLYTMLREQLLLRQRAERAADAMAAMALAKARFFAAASHDLRQPVHAIGLLAETLATSELDASTRREALAGLRGAWQSLHDLLGQVLDLARLDADTQTPNAAPVALAPLLAQLAAQHGPAAERAQVRLVLLCRGQPSVQADALMLHRVLSNLLDNAIKYTLPGGSVALAVRHGPTGRVRIQVRDAGLGIAAEHQASVFDEFERGDAPAGIHGAGLGLSIVRRFAEQMQAPLTLRSAPSRGTTVTLVLPLADLHLPTSLPACERSRAAPAQTTPGMGQRILLLEDDDRVARSMVPLLRHWGFEVRHVTDGADAMRQAGDWLPLDAQASPWALCDLRLARGESGLAVALRLQALGFRVLLVSGETDPTLLAQVRARQLPLLRKPVAAEALRAALAEQRAS